jgi:uncharacterized protein YoaH (UPF0181 family)
VLTRGERQIALQQVRELMGKRKLALDDLTAYGGEELKSRDPKVLKAAKAVERCWELMAHHGLTHADLESE